MANVTLPATGSGTATPIVATDTVGGVEYQRVKLDIGAAGASTPVTAVAPLPVTSGTRQVNISQTPTVSTTPAYTAGDAMGGLLTFANAARISGGSGLIAAVTVMCKTQALVPALELVLFNQTFTAVADNAAFNPSDADMANSIGVIPIAAWADYSLNSIATRFGLNFPFLLTGTSLFGQLVTRTAVTLGSTTDVVVGVQIMQD